MKERILYKVVKPNRQSYADLPEEYVVSYPKGAILHTVDTFGYFCFADKRHALNLLDVRGDLMLIKVKALSRVRRIRKAYVFSILLTVYAVRKYKKAIPSFYRQVVPHGTVVCKKIEVLT